MANQAQIDANRRNAKKSTGPKSKEGKSVAKLNAVKHGLTSASVVIPGEDPEELDALRHELARELEPVGRQETELVEAIAINTWRRRRIYRMEANIIAHEQAVAEMHEAEREFEKFAPNLQKTRIEDIDFAKDRSLPYIFREFIKKYEVPNSFNLAQEERQNDKEEEEDREYLAAKASLDLAREKIKDLESQAGAFLLGKRIYTDALELLMRYETAVDRSLGRARDQLARMQRDRDDRAARQAAVITVSDVTDPPGE